VQPIVVLSASRLPANQSSLSVTVVPLDWLRYWCPPTGSVPLSRDGYRFPLGGDVVRFSDIQEEPCLVLLSEPGIGKSTEMARQAQRLPEESGTSDDVVHFFHVRALQTGLLLVSGVFQGAAVHSWLTGRHRLTLYFDGLDEGLLSTRHLATKLPTLCGHGQRDRLSTRERQVRDAAR
jgi:hypothetical protein